MADFVGRWLVKVGPGPFVLMLAASVLTVSSGVILKEGGQATVFWIGVAAILAAVLVNLLRLVIWREAHRRYPLSLTYPLTGLTFPLVLAVSALYDEPVGGAQVAAVVLIAIGVIYIHRSGDDDSGRLDNTGAQRAGGVE